MRPISNSILNRRTGRKGLAGLCDYLTDNIDRDAYHPLVRRGLGKVVGASAQIVQLHSRANLGRVRIRRTIPLIR
jgi:hypothetical protein